MFRICCVLGPVLIVYSIGEGFRKKESGGQQQPERFFLQHNKRSFGVGQVVFKGGVVWLRTTSKKGAGVFNNLKH